MTADVLIIGAGVAGLSIAFHLAELKPNLRTAGPGVFTQAPAA